MQLLFEACSLAEGPREGDRGVLQEVPIGPRQAQAFFQTCTCLKAEALEIQCRAARVFCRR